MLLFIIYDGKKMANYIFDIRCYMLVSYNVYTTNTRARDKQRKINKPLWFLLYIYFDDHKIGMKQYLYIHTGCSIEKYPA